jgi:hypothetical protein
MLAVKSPGRTIGGGGVEFFVRTCSELFSLCFCFRIINPVMLFFYYLVLLAAQIKVNCERYCTCRVTAGEFPSQRKRD